MKKIASNISEPLAHIFNVCMNTGIWPNALKAAEIIPIFKSGNKQLPSNYKPISLISNIAKIMEKIIYQRFAVFFNKHKIISEK